MRSESPKQQDMKGLSEEENDLENARSDDGKPKTIKGFENESKTFLHSEMERGEMNVSRNYETDHDTREDQKSLPSSILPKSSTESSSPSKEVTFDTNMPLWKKKRNAPDTIDTALHIENMNVVLPDHQENRSITHGSNYTESTTPMTVSSTPTNIFLNQEPLERGGKSRAKPVDENRSSSIFKYRKPILFFLMAYAAVATGGGAYMLRQLFRIPGLDSQIDELRAQNDRLKVQIDRLEGQNEVLKLNVDRLEVSNVELKKSNLVFKNLVDDLEELNEIVDQNNVALINQNNLYKQNNQVLKENNIFLSSQVNETSEIAVNLTAQVALYDTLIIDMENEINKTALVVADLDLLAKNLTSQILIFEKENNRLSNITDDLLIVVSFLNDTSGDFAETYEALSDYLAEQITAYRTIRMNNHKVLYKQIITDWDCAVLTRFRLRDFAKDYTTPIGESSIDDVLTYVDERVLSDVCIERADFENFLNATILQAGEQLSDLTMADLETGVSIYTTELLNFYFPGAEYQGGLTESDWSQANYECSNLVKKFVY